MSKNSVPMDKANSDAMAIFIDPTDHSPQEADRLHLHSIDHSNLLLAIYATLRRIEDRLEWTAS